MNLFFVKPKIMLEDILNHGILLGANLILPVLATKKLHAEYVDDKNQAVKTVLVSK